MTSSLKRTADGRMLCSSHRKSGAPKFHTNGCAMCEAARAKGIIRPDISTAPPKMRGRVAFEQPFVDWDKVKAGKAAQAARLKGPQ